jgi:hypothetical protein
MLLAMHAQSTSRASQYQSAHQPNRALLVWLAPLIGPTHECCELPCRCPPCVHQCSGHLWRRRPTTTRGSHCGDVNEGLLNQCGMPIGRMGVGSKCNSKPTPTLFPNFSPKLGGTNGRVTATPPHTHCTCKLFCGAGGRGGWHLPCSPPAAHHHKSTSCL